jgi:hypothetical protein
MLSKTILPESGPYLHVKISGDFDVDAIGKLIGDDARKILQTKGNRLLIDATALLAPHTEFDRFLAGKLIADAFPHPVKVAAYARKEFINKFAEIVAVNRGANFRVFDNQADATEWLISST